MALAGATPGALAVLGWSRVPDGTPLARRSKQLYGVLEAFVTDVARRKAGLAEALRLTHRSEDKRLVKAQGPVWDQADRQHGHVPEKLRHLDTDARWSKRADQGWGYGYGLHLTCNPAGFPALLQVETAAYAAATAIEATQACHPSAAYPSVGHTRCYLADPGLALAQWKLRAPTTGLASRQIGPPSCASARQPLSRCSTSSATYLVGLPNRCNCLSNASPKFARV